jgi:hypothetical protein
MPVRAARFKFDLAMFGGIHRGSHRLGRPAAQVARTRPNAAELQPELQPRGLGYTAVIRYSEMARKAALSTRAEPGHAHRAVVERVSYGGAAGLTDTETSIERHYGDDTAQEPAVTRGD